MPGTHNVLDQAPRPTRVHPLPAGRRVGIAFSGGLDASVAVVRMRAIATAEERAGRARRAHGS
jgi:asparagine synthetase B (glutamine-hydrolysing)